MRQQRDCIPRLQTQRGGVGREGDSRTEDLMLKGKKATVELPIKVFLTDVGIDFFVKRNKKITKLSTPNGSAQHGFFLQGSKLSSLQRLAVMRYVSSIEVSAPEFSSRRGEIMDLSQLIYYGFLYQRLDSLIFESLTKTRPLRDWFLHGEGRRLGTQIKASEIRETIARESHHINSIKQRITEPIFNEIHANTDLKKEEKEIKYLVVERFLAELRPMIWYLLWKVREHSHLQELIDNIGTMVSLFFKRTDVAGYLSLLIMELNNSTELMNMQVYAEAYSSNLAIDKTVLLDPDLRHSLLKEMRKAHMDISICWTISQSRRLVYDRRSKLQVTIYGRNARYHELQEKVFRKMRARGKDHSLVSFYQSQPLGTADMGLEYLRYLKEACEEIQIGLSSRVTHIPGTDLTEISLSLLL